MTEQERFQKILFAFHGKIDVREEATILTYEFENPGDITKGGNYIPGAVIQSLTIQYIADDARVLQQAMVPFVIIRNIDQEKSIITILI